jgi:hypothetical protein
MSNSSHSISKHLKTLKHIMIISNRVKPYQQLHITKEWLNTLTLSTKYTD